MKDITPALLATLFILYSLIVLLSVELHPDNMSAPFVDNQKISDVGLRFAFKR